MTRIRLRQCHVPSRMYCDLQVYVSAFESIRPVRVSVQRRTALGDKRRFSCQDILPKRVLLAHE